MIGQGTCFATPCDRIRSVHVKQPLGKEVQQNFVSACTAAVCEFWCTRPCSCRPVPALVMRTPKRIEKYVLREHGQGLISLVANCESGHLRSHRAWLTRISSSDLLLDVGMIRTLRVIASDRHLVDLAEGIQLMESSSALVFQRKLPYPTRQKVRLRSRRQRRFRRTSDFFCCSLAAHAGAPESWQRTLHMAWSSRPTRATHH